MIRKRALKTPVRRRPALSVDTLESRQMLNASPISSPPIEGAGQSFQSLVSEIRNSLIEAKATNFAIGTRAFVNYAAGKTAVTPTATYSSLKPLGQTPIGISGPTGQPLVSGFGSTIYSPSQVDKAYGFDVAPNKGQGVTVGIVDAYGDPNIVSDIASFSTYFGLPQMTGTGGNPSLTVVQQTPGNLPPAPGGWDLETALDVEWVHAVAPMANIALIETTNNSYTNLLGYGISQALSHGAVVVSNSYGGGEFNGETGYDSTYLAGPSASAVLDFATGDDGAPGNFPAYSSNVVAVGGTSLYTASAKGAYGTEVGWSGSGGGTSLYYSTPSYQTNNGVNFGSRSEPDVSMIADPNTGVWVIDSYYAPGYLLGVGGTSLATPVFSGMVGITDAARHTNGFAPFVSNASASNSIQAKLYGDYNSANYSNDFHDVTTGNNGYSAGVGYDLVTGIGTPKVKSLVQTLSSSN